MFLIINLEVQAITLFQKVDQVVGDSGSDVLSDKIERRCSHHQSHGMTTAFCWIVFNDG